MRARSESGYILFGIVIVLVILGISLVAAVPLWQKAIQREREQELIFRGYQYMQAIERYQKKYPGAYPPNVDVLVKEKFLRKAYADPFAKDGEWSTIRQLSPELQLGAQQQQQQPGEAAGLTDLNRSRAQLRNPGGAPTGGARGSTRPPGGTFQSSMGRGVSDASMGGIVGVSSRSKEKTFYKVPGKEAYKDWLFVWGVQPGGGVPVAPMPMPGQQGQPGLPGVPGAPGQVQQVRPQLQPGASPFPWLPPPPRLTSFGFGATPTLPGQVPGANPALPGQQPTGFPTAPGQPGQGEGFPSAPGQGGFGNPGQQGFGQPGFGEPPQGMQPQQQPPRPRRRPD